MGDQQQCSVVVLSYGLNFFADRTAAVAGSDYVGRSNVLVTFNGTTRSIDVSVNLLGNYVPEEEEDFSGILTLVSDSPRVTIDPDIALATIVDNESIQIFYRPYQHKLSNAHSLFFSGYCLSSTTSSCEWTYTVFS